MSVKTCKNGHTFEKSSSCPVCPTCSGKEMSEIYGDDFPNIGAPAFRALAGIGIKKIFQLVSYTEQELLNLHGFGPRALGRLKEALHQKGLHFAKK